MKTTLLLSVLALLACDEPASSANRPQPKTVVDQYVTDYGNGIYHLDTEDARRLQSIYPGQLLSQFKQAHPDCRITAIAPMQTNLGLYGFYINCEVQKKEIQNPDAG